MCMCMRACVCVCVCVCSFEESRFHSSGLECDLWQYTSTGQLLELLREHPDNEHWWEVKNEEGQQGFVPSSYVIIKEEQVLPWLQPSALKSEEEERKIRVQRLAQEKAAMEGKGFGPPPKDSFSSSQPVKVNIINIQWNLRIKDTLGPLC